MFWSLDTDDFRGICSGQPFLLVEAGRAALLGDPPAAGEEARWVS